MILDVLRDALDGLGRAEVDSLIIGGVAMNYYGYNRATSDIDFMMVSDELSRVRRAMVDAGFINVDVRDNVVFFNKPNNSVRVDFLQIDQTTMNTLLSRSSEVDFEGRKMKIPDPKDLIAMKLFALHENWERRAGKDVPDILYLIRTFGFDVERDIKPLAMRFASNDVYSRICEARNSAV